MKPLASSTARGALPRLISRLPRAAILLPAVLVTLVAYHGSIDNGFTWDDEYVIVENHSIRSLEGAPRFFSDSATSASSTGLATVYRPLRTLTHALVFAAAGLAPAAYHAVSLALHLFNVSLVFLLGRRLGLSPGAALAVGALFGVHPLGSEAVASATAVSDLLCATFFLSAMLVHLPARESPPRPRAMALVFLFFLLSILSKEMAYSLPLVVLLGDRLLSGAALCVWPRVTYRRYAAGLLALAAVMFTVRWWLLGRAAQAAEWPGGSFVRTMAMSLDALGRYVALFFAPFPLTARHVVPVPESLPGWRAMIGFAVVAALLVAMVRLRRIPAASWGLAWFFLTLAPALNFLPIRGDFMGERYSYLPMIGLLVASISAVQAAARSFPTGVRRWSALPLVFLVLVAALTTAKRVRVWRDNRTLFEDAVTVSPESNVVRLNLAREYERLGRSDLAQAQLVAASANTRRYRDLYLRLGTAARARRNRGEAAVWYQRALRMDPGNEGARAALAELEREPGAGEP